MLCYSPLAAIIVYRLPWTWQFSKLLMKVVHAGLHMSAFVFAVIALVAVFDFHNAANIPNMYSLHSWLGLTAVILYCLQVSKHFFLFYKNLVECMSNKVAAFLKHFDCYQCYVDS